MKKLRNEINNMTEAEQIEAINNEISIAIFGEIINPSKNVIFAALEKNGAAIYYINNQTEEMKLLAINSNGHVLRNIKEPSDEVKMIALKSDRWAIRYIENPTLEMRKIALKKNGLAIKYIENPSEEEMLLALESGKKGCPNAICYMSNPTAKVMDKFNEISIKSIEEVRIKEESHYAGYFRKSASVSEEERKKRILFFLNRFVNPSDRRLIQAIKVNKEYMDYIKNPSDKVLEAYEDLYGEAYL